MKYPLNTILTICGFLALMAGVQIISISSAQAAAFGAPPCLPGIPCVTNLTPNNPATPAIEPNVPPAPNANKNDSVMCDADFMNQIYARSYLETEREVALNEVVIRKPDSVLEYSCFDQIVEMTGDIAAPIFSETTRWQNASAPNGGGGTPNIPSGPINFSVYMGSGRLDTALQRLVLDGLTSYLNSNFAHTVLGGSGPALTPGGAGGSYNCDMMNSVHFLARCNDFATDDQFLSFATLATPLDPRLLPNACANTRPIMTTALINLSNNAGYAHASFDQNAPTYRNLLSGGACTSPVPTGVQITRYEYNVSNPIGNVTRDSTGLYTLPPYEEKICTNPGCFYDFDTDTCIR